MIRVPFVDLRAQYHAHQHEFDSAFRSVIEQSAFIGGEFVQRFEKDFASANGVDYCIPVGNGTDAIYIVLKMLGIGPGDEVITTAISWISTSEAITQAGATPVFVDVDAYFTLDMDLLEEKISARTKAVMPVHLYGQPADMQRLAGICKRRGLLLIEDCAQAHFARLDGRTVGTFGDAATFSFYPGKNLGAYGDAGAILTRSPELAASCRMYANHGALRKHEHQIEGINSRLDGLQAALLSAKLPHIDDWTRRRREAAQIYDQLLRKVAQVAVPNCRQGAEHVYHLYVIRVPRRDELREFLTRRGVETAIHYPTALPFLPAYRRLAHEPADFPVAYRNQAEILSLPMYAEIRPEMIEFVCESIAAFFGD